MKGLELDSNGRVLSIDYSVFTSDIPMPTSELGSELYYNDADGFYYVYTDIIDIKPTINYEEEVERLIRQRYTVSEEFAIQRQRFDKPEEFDVYNNYCEECKNQVKQLINEAQG